MGGKKTHFSFLSFPGCSNRLTILLWSFSMTRCPSRCCAIMWQRTELICSYYIFWGIILMKALIIGINITISFSPGVEISHTWMCSRNTLISNKRPVVVSSFQNKGASSSLQCFHFRTSWCAAIWSSLSGSDVMDDVPLRLCLTFHISVSPWIHPFLFYWLIVK